MMTETRYKFLNVSEGVLKSAHGEQAWQLGEWNEVFGPVELCYRGFHCSVRMSEAFGYVQGEVVALAEVGGDRAFETDKEVWQRMRLVDVRRWGKEDSVALSIFAASLVLDNFERVVPGDDRPRKAIEAAQRYLDDPTEENRSGADSAYSAAYSAACSAADSAADSACSARSAAYSAHSAACSARSAAYSARSAARSAADSAAYSAASSAAYSAASSSQKALLDSISDWMEARFETLPVWVSE